MIAAAREELDEALDELRTVVVGLDRDSLNRLPLPQDTNSLAVLVVHGVASTRSWLSLATGAPFPDRDRDAEFRTVVEDPAVFLAEFDAAAEACRELLSPEVVFDPAREGTGPWRVRELASENVSAAAALLHALAHLNEHVGHAQLTRQLWKV
ncbi:MAG: hypothetical protein QOE83_725 [Actinomycetota bacterium]|jgi:uncharacterized damage-inducible protein DinB|nr:hypothetical protein [Actinomycetota bacterium]